MTGRIKKAKKQRELDALVFNVLASFSALQWNDWYETTTTRRGEKGLGTSMARYEHVIGAQMAEIAKLREENERLKEGLSAHGVLRAIYSDETQPTGHRIKAAIGAIDRETPRLTPQPPPIDATCEEIEPLAVVVDRRRARQDALQGRDIEVLPNGQVLLIEPNADDSQG